MEVASAALERLRRVNGLGPDRSVHVRDHPGELTPGSRVPSGQRVLRPAATTTWLPLNMPLKLSGISKQATCMWCNENRPAAETGLVLCGDVAVRRHPLWCNLAPR